jgi:hypothetical protein
MPSDSITVAQLSEAEQKRLASRYPEIREGESALVISAPRPLLSAIEEFARRLEWENEQGERVLEALLEEVETRVLRQPRVLQLHRQAEARDHFLRTVPTLTSSEVAELNGSTARNNSALANRWKAEGRIFAVNVGRTDRFPAFQFGENGKPLPAVAEIIRLFQGETDWTLALWFTAPSGWLGDRSPSSCLQDDPAGVVEAARRAVESLDV